MEVCCATSDVCYLGACTTPGQVCGTSAACPPGQGCEPAIMRCLPLAPRGTCEFRPDGGAFNPTTLWFAQGAAPYEQVMMTPVVADVSADGVPDVLANFFVSSGSTYSAPGVMRAFSGDDGRLLWETSTTAADLIHPPATIAVADLDGAGRLVAITVNSSGVLSAYDGRSGTRLWNSRNAAGTAVTCAANWGGPSIADLDADGTPEIICGFKVFGPNGVVKWDFGLGAGAVGPLTVAVDLDGDGLLEVTDGTQARRHDGTAFGWTATGAGGFPAVGDFVQQGMGGALTLGKDGRPELVVVGAGTVTLVNGQTGAVIATARIPAKAPTEAACSQSSAASPGTGGPPTVADFDGDGEAEVGVAAVRCYSMFKPRQLTATTVGLSVMWSKITQDLSSSVTGSSVFDFQGDGRAEVVYADEVALHVYDGLDGGEVFTRPHCSGTTYEYPVIVDVNNNGRADIVIAENTYARAGLGCAADAGAGIHVFRDANDQWVNTRAIWNQHQYHVTNVCDGVDLVCGGLTNPANRYGRIPRQQPNNITFTNRSGDGGLPLNNFRQNVQGDGLFNAPDFVLRDFQGDLSTCPSVITLRARLLNQGALGVLSGIKVAFYLRSPRRLVGVAATTRRLLPGESETVSVLFQTDGGTPPFAFDAVADDDGTGRGQLNECNEANNGLMSGDFRCPAVVDAGVDAGVDGGVQPQ